MRNLRIPALALAAAALGGCSTYGDYGYGHSSVSIGYGHGGYYDPYYTQYASNPYWGWYGDYYYPGSGIYVYDSYRRPYRWDDRQRIYWTQRRNYWQGRGDYREDRREFRDNWQD